jgi:hypothetical protein
MKHNVRCEKIGENFPPLLQLRPTWCNKADSIEESNVCVITTTMAIETTTFLWTWLILYLFVLAIFEHDEGELDVIETLTFRSIFVKPLKGAFPAVLLPVNLEEQTSLVV